MRIYFYDDNMRYVGNRELLADEEMPVNATTEIANVGDGQEAYLVDGVWVISDIPEPLPVE